MSLLPRRPVRRLRDGTFEVTIDAEERAILRDFCGQMRELLLADDPLLRRLFPVAYATDPEADEEWQRFAKGQLIEARFAAIETMEASLDATALTEDELTQWLQATNALRLVLGTRLDVSEDEDPGDIDPDDPDVGLRHLYDYLGWLLSFMVDALSAALPPPTQR